MHVVLKIFSILAILAIAEFASVMSAGGGPCGKVSPDKMAYQLASCAVAAKNATAPVSKSCCTQTMIVGRRPHCLCAVLLSNTAKRFGVNPKVAVTIPKRCHLRHPKGTKCGVYIVP